jgi:hypothetical protein
VTPPQFAEWPADGRPTIRRDETARGWGPSDRPAHASEIPGSARRAHWVAAAAGADVMVERMRQLAGQGWRVDDSGDQHVQMSRPSYWLPVWATVLLGLVTFGAWWVFAAWLQRSKRRDERLLTAGPDHRVIETFTRGW